MLPARHVRTAETSAAEVSEMPEEQPQQYQQAQRLPVVDGFPAHDLGNQRIPQPHGHGDAQGEQDHASQGVSCNFQFFFHRIVRFK